MSDLVRTSSGWAFYRADETALPADFNDSIQKDRIRSYIMNNLRGRVEDWLLVEAERFIAQAREIGFNEAADAGDITKNSFGPIPLNYGDTVLFSTVSSSGIPELSGASQNQFFWRTAFSTPLNSISEPIVIGDNVIILLPLEEVFAEEGELDFIESYYSYWASSSTENAYRSYFLQNEKLDDRFNDMFWKIWSPN